MTERPPYPLLRDEVNEANRSEEVVTQPSLPTTERARQDARFHELRAAGATYAFIAAEFGVTVQAVSKRYSAAPRPVELPPGRCMSRVRHSPHVARWQNNVTTLCDGHNGASS